MDGLLPDLLGEHPDQTDERSARRDVRNPLLALPAAKALMALPPHQRDPMAALLRELATRANELAEHAWRTRKAPMAAYWRAVCTYARHTARLLSTR